MPSDASSLVVEASQVGPIPLNAAFACEPGEVLALFGPSGSGKTTLLRTIAGLYHPAHARVSCGQEVWVDTATRTLVPAHRRRVGLVFQEYALFPHLTVLGNVVAAMGHRPRAERAGHALALLERVHLGAFVHRRPADLSGGQRQRVALARALARDPAVLLLDEPFAAVDRGVRAALYGELETLRQSLSLPIVLVTHDFDEVVRLADRLVVLERGEVIAFGTVSELTQRSDLPQLAAFYDPGSVLNVRVAEHVPERRLTRLEYAGGSLWSPQLDASPGSLLRVRIPAREVSIALEAPAAISSHNCVRVTIQTITDANDPALVLVALRVGDGSLLLSQVTQDAVVRLRLAPGDVVHALIKSVSVLRPGVRAG